MEHKGTVLLETNRFILRKYSVKRIEAIRNRGRSNVQHIGERLLCKASMTHAPSTSWELR